MLNFPNVLRALFDNSPTARSAKRQLRRWFGVEVLENRCLLTVDIPSVLVGNEGDTLQLDISYSGEGTIDIDWGDGSPVGTMLVADTFNGREGDGTLSCVHRYLDDQAGGYTITVDGSSGSQDMATVTVNNVAPDVGLSAVLAGLTSRVTGTISDPGILDTFIVDLNWGDEASPNEDNIQQFTLGTTTLTESEDGINWNPTTRTFSLTHLHSGSGPFTITADVTDDDGGMADPSPTVQTVTLVPDLVLSASPEVFEGSEGSISATLFGFLDDPEDPSSQVPFEATEDVTVTLDFSGTAMDPDDYSVVVFDEQGIPTATSQIVIPAGSSSASVTILTVDDEPEVDPNEAIIVDVANVAGGGAVEDGNQQATVTILEEALPLNTNPTVILSVGPLGIDENGGEATITASLVDDPESEDRSFVVSNVDVTVNLGFSGSATGYGTDYNVSATSIVIPAGLATGTATITAIDDGAEVDQIESVIVDITGVTNGTEGGQQQGTTFITEAGALGVALTVEPSAITEASGEATLTSTLVDPLGILGDADTPVTTSDDVTVGLGFSGDATNDTDYEVTDSGDNVVSSIIIPLGSESTSVTITAIQDPDLEGDESVVVDINTVAGPSNVVELGEQQVTTTIRDDDLPVVELSAAPSLIAEDGGVGTFTATLLDPVTRQPTTVNEDINVSLLFFGSATNGVDYTPSSSTILIPAQSSSGSLMITANDDGDIEGNEAVVPFILAAPGANIGNTDTLTIVDDDGVVEALAADAGGPYFVDEGDSVQLDGSDSISPVGSIFDWDLDGDNIFGEAGETGVTPTFSAAGLDGASSAIVTLRIRNVDRTVFDTATVTLNNVIPTLTLDPVTMIDENGVATLTGTITDPGTPDTFTLDIDWGDPLSPDNVETYTFAASPTGTQNFTLTHQYLDDNPTNTPQDTYTISATVTDDDDIVGDSDTETVLVKDVAPTLTLDPVTMIDENGVATLTGTIADPGTLDTFTLDINWGDPLSPDNTETYTFAASATGTRNFTLTHQYLDDNPTNTDQDTYAISATVTDDDTLTDSDTTSVLVKNVAPTLTVDPITGVGAMDDKATVDDLVTLSGSFTDPGTLDTHTVVIDWGEIDDNDPDNTTLDQTVLTIGANDPRSFSETHQYTTGGIFTVTVTVTDDDTGVDVDSSTEIWVTGARIHPTTGVLQVIGTSDDDNVKIIKTGNNLKVNSNFFTDTFPGAADTNVATSILVYLCGGDDQLNVTGPVAQTTIAHGGPGNDKLNAGNAPAVLDGGPGDDKIIGGKGRNILVGDDGADRLIGQKGEDILIAGLLNLGVFDLNGDGNVNSDDNTRALTDEALLALIAEWDGPGDYDTRVANLSDMTGIRLEKDFSVFDDDDIDKLTGSADQDWFFALLSLDDITDLHIDDEFVN